jgi:hypothetical protein
MKVEVVPWQVEVVPCIRAQGVERGKKGKKRKPWKW